MSISTVSVYSKSYENVPTGLEESEAAEGIEAEAFPQDLDSMVFEDEAADAYVDDTADSTSLFTIDHLRQIVRQWGEETFANNLLSQDERLSLYRQSQSFLGQLQSRAADEAVPQGILDQYLLLQGKVAEASVHAQVAEAASAPLAKIEQLHHDIEAMLAVKGLDEESQSQLLTHQAALGKAKSSLELSQSAEDVAQAESLAAETLAQVEEFLLAAQAGQQEKAELVGEKLEAISQVARDAKCTKKDRLKAAKQIADIKNQFENGEITAEAADEKLDAIAKDIDEAVADKKENDALKDSFRGLSKLIDTRYVGSEESVELVDRISKAVENGHWNGVLSYLDTMTKNDDIRHYESEIAIENIIGIMYYGPAGESDKKLKKMLDLLPEKVRQKMIDVMKLNPDDWRGFGVDDDAIQKREHMIYGKRGATTAILKASMN